MPRDTAAQTAQGALVSALEASGGAGRDDIAVLVVQVRGAALDRRGNGAESNLRHGDNAVR